MHQGEKKGALRGHFEEKMKLTKKEMVMIIFGGCNSHILNFMILS
jgi:hypothetical protein